MNTHALMRQCRSVVDVCRHVVRWHESEEKITRDAQTFWEESPPQKRDLFSHWRNAFDDDQTWLEIGRENLRLFETFARLVGLEQPMRQIVEWGCGGGANAVHFGKLAGAFYGVDITEPSLDECQRQMHAEGLHNFHPVLIQASAPESALSRIPAAADLFICFYVFELFPTPEYGLRILRIAHQMLKPGGMAMVQFKYPVGYSTRSRRWGYRFGAANMTTYQIADFWEAATTCGFTPHAVSLMPKQPLVQDERYAYIILTKA